MRGAGERLHPHSIHPHESLVRPHKCIFHRGGFNLHLYSRSTCLLICQLLPTSFLCLKYCKLQPSNQSCSQRRDPYDCTKQVLTPATFQVLCKSNAAIFITGTHTKLACPPPAFPFLLYLSACLSLVCTTLTARTFSFHCLELHSYRDLP